MHLLVAGCWPLPDFITTIRWPNGQPRCSVSPAAVVAAPVHAGNDTQTIKPVEIKMHTQYRLLIALALIVSSTMASAALTPGTGGGYFGTAWFTNGQGMIVGPYSTWFACNQQYQQSLDYNVNVRGWTIDTQTPCSYNPPASVASPNHALSFDVDSSDPGTSLEDAKRIIEEIRVLRESHMIDEYQAELRRIK